MGEEHFRQRGSECAGPGAGVCVPTRQRSASVAELSVGHGRAGPLRPLGTLFPGEMRSL